ncbi:MAG: hypothetical protein HUJ61_00585 [Bacilli bacterium]|nr:hypothetical protein [Bacilli bacterium]
MNIGSPWKFLRKILSVINFIVVVVAAIVVIDTYSFDFYAIHVIASGFLNGTDWYKYIGMGVVGFVALYALFSFFAAIGKKRGAHAVFAPFGQLIASIIWFTALAASRSETNQTAIFVLSIIQIIILVLCVAGFILTNPIIDRERRAILNEAKNKNKKQTSTGLTLDDIKFDAASNKLKIGDKEIVLNIQLPPGYQASNGTAVVNMDNASNNAPTSTTQPVQPKKPTIVDKLGDVALEQGGTRGQMYLNDLLAPTKVHAPASGTKPRPNLGGPENEEDDDLKDVVRNKSSDEESTTSNGVSSDTDAILKELGIDLSLLKSLDASDPEYQKEMEKVLESISSPSVGKLSIDDDEDEDEGDAGDFDYELIQIEDYELTKEELKELKLVIGDPSSNIPFIEKYQALDDDLRLKYMKIRYRLLSSKEKTLTSRVTRYFDTYYWRGRMVARIALQGKTIKLFLALNPKDYDNTRISVSDESDKLIYRYVPTLIRIRTDMSYKRSKKLIDDMLGARQLYEAEVVELTPEPSIDDLEDSPIIGITSPMMEEKQRSVKSSVMEEDSPIMSEEEEHAVPAMELVPEGQDIIEEIVLEEPKKEQLPTNEEPDEKTDAQFEKQLQQEAAQENNADIESLFEDVPQEQPDEDDPMSQKIAGSDITYDELERMKAEFFASMAMPDEEEKTESNKEDTEDESSEDNVDDQSDSELSNDESSSEEQDANADNSISYEYEEEVNENGEVIDSKDEENESDETAETELNDESVEEDNSVDNVESSEEENLEENEASDESSTESSTDEDEEEAEDSDDDGDDSDSDDEDEDAPAKTKSSFPSKSSTNSGDGSAIVHKNFTDKILNADPDLQAKYNEICSLIDSYGVKARIAKSNESFRFKKKLLVKMTVQGKSLKVFLALDPFDYVNKTKFTLKDVSEKHAYAEVPVLMKVRSDLSLKRVKTLIGDVMIKNGVLQEIYTYHDYVEDLRNQNND